MDGKQIDQQTWNAAIDKAQEIVNQWIESRESEEMLIDRLSDAKIWT